MPTNDNDFVMPAGMLPHPDAHGHAALLLVESLIHGLLARSIISTEDAIDIVESAESVQVDVAEEADGAGAPMWRSHELLTSISKSLKVDGDRSSTFLRPIQ